MESMRLLDLQQFIKQVIALNFSRPYWITVEISQAKCSNGHWYIHLIEKNELGIVAEASATCWKSTYGQLLRTHGAHLTSLLKEGVEVKIQVMVRHHERFGLQLEIVEVDPAFTLGQMEMERQATITRLEKEQLLLKNKQLPVPLIWQRLAIFSSPEAAGLADFMVQLSQNGYGYAFDVQLFPIAVQGLQVASSIQQQMVLLHQMENQFDAVIVIRGGGSKIDLAGFDKYEVAAAFAKCRLPVITGIGHEVDQSVCDIVAFQSLKTPTAAAEWIISKALAIDSQLEYWLQGIQQYTQQTIRDQNVLLSQLETQLQQLSQNALQHQHYVIKIQENALQTWTHQALITAEQQLNQLVQTVELCTIESALRKGFAVVRSHNKEIPTKDWVLGTQLDITTQKGSLTAAIQQLHYGKK